MEIIGTADPVEVNRILLTPFLVCLKDLKANGTEGKWSEYQAVSDNYCDDSSLREP
jgi:hypothetical protein